MRHKEAKNAAVLGIIGNIFLLIIKGIVAFTTNSQAMISDVFNSIMDIFSSFMTYIGNKIASKEADDDHNLGHGKAEYIFSMLISVMMLTISLTLIYNSIMSLTKDYDYNFSYSLIIVCSITIITKLFLYIYTRKIAKKYDNLLVKANSYDHRNDCFLTTLTLISSIFGMYGITAVDGIIGSIVALWIFITGAGIFKTSFDVLMDKGIDDELKTKIMEIITSYPEIKKVNHLNSTPNGYQFQISVSIFVDGELSTYESHEIAHKLEKELTELDEIYLAIIHVNPIKVKKKRH